MVFARVRSDSYGSWRESGADESRVERNVSPPTAVRLPFRVPGDLLDEPCQRIDRFLEEGREPARRDGRQREVQGDR